MVGPLGMMALLFAVGGYDAFLWGYVVSTCALMHGTFTINSLAHVFGSRRYATTDTSRNNFWLALITLGEGWHNNHHHYMSSANQGFFWWEIDVSFYILRAMEKLRPDLGAQDRTGARAAAEPDQGGRRAFAAARASGRERRAP